MKVCTLGQRALAVSCLLALSGCGASVNLGDDGTSGGKGGAAGGGGQPSTGGFINTGGSAPFGGAGAGGGSFGGGAGGSAPDGSLPACDAVPGQIAFDAIDEALNRDVYLAPGDGSQPSRLTSDPATDYQPALSPDGTQVVFTSFRSGSPQLYLMDIDDLDARPLTDRPEGADQASFSHDGTRIAFHSGASIYWMDLNEQIPHFVAEGLDDFNAYHWPRFSPDDSELFFDRNNEINAVKLDGSDLRPIVRNTTTQMSAPMSAPSGNVVAYQVNCYNLNAPSIWLVPSDKPSNMCEGRLLAENAEHPAFSPYEQLAFERIDRRRNEAQIALVYLSGTGTCAFTPLDGRDARNPSWSP